MKFTTMNPGRHTMPASEYHANEAIGKSTLDLIHRDPYLVEWSRKAPVDDSDSDALKFGTALHSILLEPEKFVSEYAVAPKSDMRTNAGKAEYADFVESSKGKAILSADDYRKLQIMRDSVMAHPQAVKLIEAEGEVEQSWFWKDERTGLQCKCRPDKYIPSSNLLVDVKSTASIAKFAYSVEDYRYYVQDPWYCDGVSRFNDEVEMFFLVVQKTLEAGRYPVQVFRLPQDVTVYGRQVYRKDLDAYAQFLKIGAQTQEIPMHGRFLDHVIDSLEITV